MTAEPFLTTLRRFGKPLVEFSAVVTAPASFDEVLAKMNALAPDLHAARSPYDHARPVSERRLLSGDTTAEAVERLFGWKLAREEYQAGFFRWREMAPPSRMPREFEGLVRDLGIVSPGADDDAEPDLVRYRLSESGLEIDLTDSAPAIAFDLWQRLEKSPRRLVQTFASWAAAASALQAHLVSGGRSFWIARH